MRRSTLCWAILAVLATVGRAAAGEFNSVLNLGDRAPSWSVLPGVDGKTHSLADLKDKDVVVLFFTCNSCPIASDYEDRIIAAARKFAAPGGKAAFVAINVNTDEEDLLPKMKERAEAKGFPFPYLFDQSQKIAKAYGAIFTPEFFVIDKARKIAYMGGFDDNLESTKVNRRYLEAAVQAVLNGKKPSPAETAAGGCMIRYERSRRKKPPK